MNNSLERIFEAMAAALRRDIVPQLQDAHARRQAIALIDVLNHLRLRTDWSPDPLYEAVTAQTEALQRLQQIFDDAPFRPPITAIPALPDRVASPGDLVAARDQLDELISRTLEWIELNRPEIGEERAASATEILASLIHDQLRHDIQLTPKPLFGQEK